MKLAILFLVCFFIHSISCNFGSASDKRGLKKLTQQRRLKASPDSSGVKGRTNKSFNKNLASKSSKRDQDGRRSKNVQQNQHAKKLSANSYGVLGDLSAMRSAMYGNMQNPQMSFAQSLGFGSPYDQSQYGAYNALKQSMGGSSQMGGFGMNSMMPQNQYGAAAGMFQNAVPLSGSMNGYNGGYGGNGVGYSGFGGNQGYSPIVGSGKFGRNRRFNLAKYEDEEEDEENEEEEEEVMRRPSKRTRKNTYAGKNKQKSASYKDRNDYKENDYSDRKYRGKKPMKKMEEDVDDSYTSYKDSPKRRSSNYRKANEDEEDEMAYDNNESGEYNRRPSSNKNSRRPDEVEAYEKPQGGVGTRNLKLNIESNDAQLVDKQKNNSNQNGREEITKLNSVRNIQALNNGNNFQIENRPANVEEILNDPAKTDQFIRAYKEFVQ